MFCHLASVGERMCVWCQEAARLPWLASTQPERDLATRGARVSRDRATCPHSRQRCSTHFEEIAI